MTATEWRTKRFLVGAIALVCLATAAGLWIFTENPETNQFLSAVTRIGTVMAALWIALPERGENIAWGRAATLLIPALVVVALIGRRFIYLLPAAIVVALALAFLRPRTKGRKLR